MILLFWLGVWQITAVCVDNFLLVVTPLQALRAIIVLAGQVEFWRSALGSLWRIAAGFLLGAVLGLLLATVSYRCHLADEVLRPFMVFCKAVPVAVFAVLLLIWWGASPLAVAVCFLVVFPNIYLNTLEGLKSAAGFIKRQLAKTINLRNTPEITFVMDQSIEYGVHMSQKINQVIAYIVFTSI